MGTPDPPLFADRVDAGRQLARELEGERGPDTVVLGLARGGVVVAAEVARALGAPLDTIAVRKVGHPWQPELAIGAVTPGGGLYLRGRRGRALPDVDAAVEEALVRADELDAELRGGRLLPDLFGRTVIVVDDGVATGATMIASLRWVRGCVARRVVAAVPVGAPEGLAAIRHEADSVVCPFAPADFEAVGNWYARFAQVETAEVVALLAEGRLRGAALS